MSDALVSIIVPVYKVEEYLNQCIDSIVNQTYKNLEIILVDDGSPDRCPQICDEWREKDSRIKVIHKENGGLSDARNAGLKIAKGDYIGFVDSDDQISLQMYGRLMQAMEETGAGIVECNYLKFEKQIPQMVYEKSKNVQCYSTESALEQLIIERVFHHESWNKLYRKYIFETLCFEKGKLHEDVYLTYQAFGMCEKIAKIDEVLYYYRQRCESIMGTSFSLKNLDSVEARCRLLEYMNKNYPELVRLAQNQLMGNCLYFGQLALKSKDEDLVRQTLHFVEPIFQQVNRSRKFYTTWKQEGWYLVAGISFRTCCRMRNRLAIGI